MATIKNDRDVLLQATSPRFANSPSCALVITADTTVFHVTTGGAGSPTVVNLTANLLLIPGMVTWSVISGASSVTPIGNTCTLAFANMTAASATVQATITYNTVVYTATVVVAKVVDGTSGANGTNGTNGTNGANGSRGSCNLVNTSYTSAASAITATNCYNVVTGSPYIYAAALVGDIVTFAGATGTSSSHPNTWLCTASGNPGTWAAQALYVDGSMIVTGTITALGTVTAGNLNTSGYISATGSVSLGGFSGTIYGYSTGSSWAVVGNSTSYGGKGVYGHVSGGGMACGVSGDTTSTTSGIGVLGSNGSWAGIVVSGAYGVYSGGNAYVDGTLTVTGNIYGTLLGNANTATTASSLGGYTWGSTNGQYTQFAAQATLATNQSGGTVNATTIAGSGVMTLSGSAQNSMAGVLYITGGTYTTHSNALELSYDGTSGVVAAGSRSGITGTMAPLTCAGSTVSLNANGTVATFSTTGYSQVGSVTATAIGAGNGCVGAATSGTGVYGQATSGWAGYFSGTNGVYASGRIQAGGYFACNGATAVAAPAGYGTPTGNARTASFAASTISLANLAAEVAQLVIDLKAIGLIAA